MNANKAASISLRYRVVNYAPAGELKQLQLYFSRCNVHGYGLSFGILLRFFCLWVELGSW